MKVRIYYEDTDCGGVVYYANYFKYFERGRTDYLEQRGVSVAALLRHGTQFMVVRAEADYRSPARYGETLRIETSLTACGRASLTFAHRIVEERTRRLVVEGSAVLAAVDLQGRVKRLDPGLVAKLGVVQDGLRDGGERRRAVPRARRVRGA